MSSILKKRILKNLQNTYCQIKKSKIDGVGVFAIREIPIKTKLFTSYVPQPSVRFKLSELKRLPTEVLKLLKGFLVLENNGTMEIPQGGLEGLDMSFYLNHSSQPNVKIINGGADFVTLRKIRKGEELTIDYQKFDNIKKDNKFFN